MNIAEIFVNGGIGVVALFVIYKMFFEFRKMNKENNEVILKITEKHGESEKKTREVINKMNNTLDKILENERRRK